MNCQREMGNKNRQEREGRDMLKPGLLIVEDDEEIREQLGWALADSYTVYPAGNPREALECS